MFTVIPIGPTSLSKAASSLPRIHFTSRSTSRPEICSENISESRCTCGRRSSGLWLDGSCWAIAERASQYEHDTIPMIACSHSNLCWSNQNTNSCCRRRDHITPIRSLGRTRLLWEDHIVLICSALAFEDASDHYLKVLAVKVLMAVATSFNYALASPALHAARSLGQAGGKGR